MEKQKSGDDDAKAKKLKEFGFKEREKLRQEFAVLFCVKQEVVFNGNEDNDIGIRRDVLEEIIKKYVPIVSNNGSTRTVKKVIDIDYIRRIGGPSSMLVLIKVNFFGLVDEECWKRQGLYLLRLDIRNNGYAVKVEKLHEKELICEDVYEPEESEKSSQATIDYGDAKKS